MHVSINIQLTHIFGFGCHTMKCYKMCSKQWFTKNSFPDPDHDITHYVNVLHMSLTYKHPVLLLSKMFSFGHLIIRIEAQVYVTCSN